MTILSSETKGCSGCGETKNLSAFRADPRYAQGVSFRCRSCESAASQRYQKAHPEQVRQTKYGVSFETWWVRQKGLCAICGDPMLPQGKTGASVVVDHDHTCCSGRRSCGKCVRGLIRKKCNGVLGHAGDSIKVLKGAVAYLDRWRESLS